MTREELYEQAPWQDHYPDHWPTEESLDVEHATVPDLLSERADEFASHPFLLYQRHRFTFQDVKKRADAVTNYLLNHGIRPGDHVGVAVPNSPQTIVGVHGILGLGAVYVPVSFLQTERELAFQLKDAECRSLIMHDRYLDRLEAIIDETPVEEVLVTSLSTHAAPELQKNVQPSNTRLVNDREWTWFQDALDEGFGYNSPTTSPDPDDRAWIVYTGGTTGRPKGIPSDHASIVGTAALFELLDLVAYKDDGTVERGEGIVSGAMPMFHSNGNVTGNLAPLYNGSCVILYPQFHPRALLEDIETYGINHIHAVPTMLQALVEEQRFEETDFSSLRHVMVGSAPVSPELCDQFEKTTGAPVFEFWAQSESGGGTAEAPKTRRTGSCGLPMPGVIVDVMDPETGEFLPPGEVGELVVQQEPDDELYWNRPQVSRETRYDGWHHTGDLGYRDKDWFFYFADRADDMIVSAGHNVYPKEVENVLYEHQYVSEAVVVGLSDEYQGKKVVAVVTPSNDNPLDDRDLVDSLSQWCESQLAPYKQPQQIHVWDNIPKNPVGKVRRVDVQDLLLERTE